MFSFVVYQSRKQRDRMMKKIMVEPRFKEYMHPKNMPFDGKRMFWGGFKASVEH